MKEVGVLNVGRMEPVLDVTVEMAIHGHLKMMEAGLFGMTTIDVRRLAYAVAEKLGVPHRFSHDKKMAGYDWLRGFLGRHTDLSVRVPQGTNIARAVGFNREKVGQFFSVYSGVLDQHTYTSPAIWNMEETGITNVHIPGSHR